MDTTRQKQKRRSGAQWYLLAYDIRHEKRLRRLHYFCKKNGVPLQKSVFLFKADAVGLEELVEGVQERVNDKEDDVRLYPVPSPGSIWAAGRQNDKLRGLYGAAPQPSQSKVEKFFRNLFAGKKGA
jgi:CRISPR-associated protein Cas2